MGYLASKDNKPLLIVLNREAVKLTGKAFVMPEKSEIGEGMENLIFEQYASEHPHRKFPNKQ